MTGFTFRLAAAASAFVLASGPVAGQQLYAAGLAGVVEHLRSGGVVHTLSTVSGDGDERCTASGAALAAEAERTPRARRDRGRRPRLPEAGMTNERSSTLYVAGQDGES